MKILYKKLVKKDTQKISDFEKRIYGEEEGWSVRSIDYYFDNNNLNPYFVYIDNFDSEPIGIIAYTLEKNNRAWIATNAIIESERRKGISTQMLEFAFNRIKQMKYDEIFLMVRNENSTAISLYKKIGFNFLLKQDNKERSVMSKSL